MPIDASNSMLNAIGAGTALIALCSAPALSSIVTRLSKRDAKQDTYEDGDGKATLESIKAYSAKLPKSLALTSAAAGLAMSIALLGVSPHTEGRLLTDSLGTGAWALLLFQAAAVASSRSSVQAYRLGIYTFFSAIVLGGILLAQGTETAERLLKSAPAAFALGVVELVCSVSLAISALCIPRRPDVFYQGELVDRMYTVSAFSRFTWSWPSGLLNLASKKKDLDLADLTRPDQYTRAAAVSADWKKLKTSGRRLWLSLVLAHKKPLALQWLATLAASVLNFAPQWVILQLLRFLETREPGKKQDIEAWMWVVWLGIVIIAQSWVESYVWWLAYSELQIPIRAQLSALIFEKSMRRKDVKGGERSKTKTSQEGDAEAAGPTTPSAAGVEEDDSEKLKKSKQSTVNLIGVDGKRVSDFCAYQNLLPGSLFKLVVSLVFLVDLLGWKPLLAGFSAMLAIMPVNIYFSKRYSDSQDRLMKVRDAKMEVVTEALQGIRQIKFSALEPEWEKKIGDVRERELSAVWSVFMNDTMLLACWVTSPILLSAISLAVYAALTGSLAPSVAFVSLGVFKGLEMTLSIVPELTTDLLDAWVSIKRIEQYLNSPEVETISKDADEVSFDNTSIAWPSDEEMDESERFVLRNINITFPKGELSVISGKTGTGKSLMLAAILGEVDVLGGTIYVPRAPPLSERHDSKANKGNWIIPEAIAYVAQIPWIENASIKENILFGLPYDEERYNKTVATCALKKDLEMLDDGENTEIGANGINLSGGQKWRVTLARAIYSRAGILVLDDIFSAVDAHVGRHIFEKCLNGELAVGRTRILVTHHVALCEPKTKYLVELGDGGVLHAGLLSELREEGTLQKIKSHEQTAEEVEADELATAANSDGSSVEEREQDGVDGNTLKKVTSKAPVARKFVEEETREQGHVKKHVYSTYLKDSGGFFFWIFALFVFLVVQGLNVGRSWWLKIWTGNYQEQAVHSQRIPNIPSVYGYSYADGVRQTSIHAMSAPAVGFQGTLVYYLGIYVALAVISSIIGTLKYLYIYFGSIRASRKLFAKLNFTILRTPIRWLDTVPVGRILNRYTADFNTIDSQLANSVSFGANSFLGLMAVIVAGLFVSPLIVLLAVILLLICLYYAIRYLNGARPVKRLESTTKSPVFEQFGSALTGVTTIRGFGKAQVYVERMYRKIDDYSTATWHLWLFNRWMGWRMSLVGSFFSSFVSILILLTPGIDSALAGFALAFALEFSSSVMWTIRLYANVELNMNAAERIIEYTELPTEALGGESPPAAWPTEGRIEVNDLVVAYAPDLPPVLKGLTFSINRNERIGVVGRTGAGKSSLTLALFRFLAARSGSIHVDGLDISKIKLHDLRSRLAIIPQDPVLFSGTIRSNLDPFNHHTDAELRDCLERVHLVTNPSSSHTSTTTTAAAAALPGDGSAANSVAPKNTNPFADLSSPVSEGGLNLSQGQRQLLCLARAIVSRPKVMVLDEATSAVDMHTDALIQRSIREEFGDATLLVIAHRLSTIADFDRVLVLSDGRVAEFGTPRELWEIPGGMFRAMCEESGERERLRGIVFGEGKMDE
ncbi:P-loop containing nucleoside triphosphate hydrolase protein [Parathielavia appendiculata]|uniref:P-loop containing nucleoside triphosphate hydrolase protein n=1 Tax=Parathielavia appendiculata TaxID=2587402 RepID=A0AAN6Z9V8_9PEZI|nr:P-loop containing nucleoside triphosphate hydrolase protein [Parathielavia appendiculata]